jgi:hypothetical protein
MNVQLTNIVVPRYTFIPRDDKRYNSSDRRIYNSEETHHNNQHQNPLQNEDQRKVSFNFPKVAAMNVEEYSDAHDQNYEEEVYYDTDEQFEAENYDEQVDELGINNVQTDKKNYTVCEMEDNGETWGCPLVEV